MENTSNAGAATTGPKTVKTCFQYRQELLKLQVYPSSETYSNSFFPEPKLRKLFTENAVSDILACNCESCEMDSRAKLDYFAMSEGKYKSEIPQDYVSSLALLVLIGHTQLIQYFPWKERKDSHLEALIGKSPKKFLSEVWPGYKENDEETAFSTAREFLKELPRFCVPTLSNFSYVKWSKERILPFIENKELSGDRWSAKVVAFKIEEGYKDFKDLNITDFVRKEISIKESDLFVTQAAHEKVALQLVRELDDPHIVRMIKTYSLGETFNIIFPRAKTNLAEFLRDSTHKAHEICDCRSSDVSFWNQMVGIAKALSKVHHAGEEAEKQGSPKVGIIHVDKALIGCHFDLKPANILVDEGKCLITDFGQAVFEEVESGRSSNIHIRPGTEAYAPPRENTEKPTRRIDIWSLGCIFLEVAAFWVRGHEGVTELDKVRATPSHEKHIRLDVSFHATDPNTGDFILKPTVDAFMKSLPSYLKVEQAIRERSEEFLDQLLGLIRSMLEPNPAKRPPSRKVYEALEDILIAYTGADTPAESASTQSSTAGEHELRKKFKDEMWLNWDGEWKSIEVKISKVAQSLRFDNHLRYERSGRLSLDRWITQAGKNHCFVPSYCFKPFNTPGRATWISLAKTDDDTPRRATLLPPIHTVDVLNYAFRSKESAQSFQSLITRHKLYEIFDLQHIKAIPHITTSMALARVAKKGIARANSLPLLKNNIPAKGPGPDLLKWENNGASIQLWIENKSRSPENGGSLQGPTTENGVPHRRYVIYGVGIEGKSIAIIRMHQNFKIDKDKDIWGEDNGPQNEHETSDGFELSFVPRDKSRDEKFSVTVIPPSQDAEGQLGFAAIPLNPETLGKCEDENRTYCKEIRFKFTSRQKRKEFSQQYLWRYQKWSNERKGIPGYQNE